MFHSSITVPPGGKTVLFPSVTECYFLSSPFICWFFFCDHLEMSSKSNIFISCVAVIYWKGCNKISATCIIKSNEEKGKNIEMVHSGVSQCALS